jgi:aminoglycoside phosphotransferase (APT) family kinase protein
VRSLVPGEACAVMREEIEPDSEDGSVNGDGPDPQWLRARLADCIWRDDEIPCRLASIDVRRRRKSRRGTTTVYALGFQGGDDQTVEQLYVGYEVPLEALDAQYTSALSEATIAPPFGRAVVQVPEANLLLLAFPNDRQMRVPGDDGLRACMARVATRLANRGRRRRQVCRVKEASFHVLRYVPGQRLTLRCCGSFETDRGVEQPFAFIAKQFRKPNVAKALHRSLVALDKHFSASRAVWLPRPVGFDKETGLVLMEELPGKDLKRAFGEVDVSETMWGVGRMLAAFHQAPQVVRSRASVHEAIEDVRDVSKKIEKHLPAGVPRLSACFARCLSARWTDNGPTVLLHGAFRPQHVFVHDGRLAMIDVDGMCVGHPAHDIAHFLTALYYLEAQEVLSAADRSVAVGRFLEGYSASAPWQLHSAAILWCTAVLLVYKQARRFVLHVSPDGEEKVDRALTLAEKALAACADLRDGAGLEVVRDVLC